MVTIEDFRKIELRLGKVLTAERIENSDKLLNLRIDLGEETGERQIIAGIGRHYAPEELLGRHVVVCANLEPRSIMGLESQGMLLAAGGPDSIAVLQPDPAKNAVPGMLVK